MSTKPENRITPSRRTMIAASGALVAGGVVSPGIALGDDRKSEIAGWKELVGQRFMATPVGQKTTTDKRLRLIDVREMDFDDPARPAEFRKPFCLHFENLSGKFSNGTYMIASRKVGRKHMHLHNVIEYETGTEVIEAVFG